MKLNIKSPPLKGIQLSKQSKQVLNNCFINLIIGPPGSGKTSTLKALIQDQRFYGNKFDRIIFVGPSPFDQSFDQTNSLTSPDPVVISTFIQSINQQNDLQDFNLLFIFDDCVTQMTQKNDFWKKLFLNRRHLIKGGTISHIITSQKFSLVPPFIRACLTQSLIFKTSLYQSTAIAKWFMQKQKTNKFLNAISNLSQHQFVYVNFLKNKMYNNQFLQVDKKICKLKINGHTGSQSATLYSSFVEQQEHQQQLQKLEEKVVNNTQQHVQPQPQTHPIQEVQSRMTQMIKNLKSFE